MNKIIVIVGPTAVGKTKMSIELAKIYNGEVINADSTQIYKGLNIATAKVTKEEMEDIPHHLLDFKNINEDYSIFDYQKDARKCIEDISQRGKTPILVGGTGLYIKAALYDYQFEEEKREKHQYEMFSTEELYKKLKEVDKNTLIHQNNRKRIIRALEYYDKNGIALSEKEKTDTLLYDAIFIGLTTDRDVLYQKINDRVDKMVESGLLEESFHLYKQNSRSKAIMTPIGYKELFPYFDKTISMEEALDIIKRNSRRYAKRQYTFFRNQLPVIWFDTDYTDFSKTVSQVIEYIESV